ncbi:ParB/RepB/Spo0J family partition protein [Solirubrobacter pauli]|uniref:ParB/RepB/Spo0J family partition protein n=1 Tax=Solirubrobacter pauli TaxID=166793 RepID=A0A660LFA1_9ACTN|nr:ParB/RepB/Spo0J family partition protein [Solirubrobacter pauli]RKQ92976.1 ParB/RepB/Spo0J family partition protein [Solirubrobacter pauli]
MTAPPVPANAASRVALDRIGLPENVRPLDMQHVDALAGSIRLQGIVVPLVVRAAGDDTDAFELVAGFHRFAAAQALQLPDVPVVVRDADTEDADRALENIARKALDPREEARAVQAMLARGLTEDGAAQALGWSRQRVAARVKLLELPESAQQLVGDGVVALSAVDRLLAIGRVSQPLLDALIAFLADGNGWAAERLAREPGWVLDSALRQTDTQVFAAHLSSIRADQIAELRLGKKADALYEQATKLHKQLDRQAYGAPEIRFSDEDVDQARAAGVLIEFERTRPIITDRALYRELTKAAIKRTVAELEARIAAAAEAKQRSRAERRTQPDDPMAAAARERDASLRGLADQAHGANLDLGQSLLHGLSVVDPADMHVARFFVYGLLGPDWDASPYTQTGDRVQRLAANGIRLVVGELRQDVTKTRKDGTPGRLRMDYGDHRKPEAAVKWLWRYIDGAKTAGELYGRALVVIAAEQYASRLVLPAGHRMPATRWSSRKDVAGKALNRLVGPHMPASLKQLERAVKRAHETYAELERPTDETPAEPTSNEADEDDDLDAAPAPAAAEPS